MNLLKRKEFRFSKRFFSRGYNFKREYTLYNDKAFISFEVDAGIIKNTQDIMSINKIDLDFYSLIPERIIGSVYELESLKMNRVRIGENNYKKSAKLTYSIEIALKTGYEFHIDGTIGINKEISMGRNDNTGIYFQDTNDLVLRRMPTIDFTNPIVNITTPRIN